MKIRSKLSVQRPLSYLSMRKATPMIRTTIDELKGLMCQEKSLFLY